VAEVPVEYWVDPKDRLLEVDDAFRAFAIRNGAPELASDSILGRSIASFCSDDATTEIWRRVLARARAGAIVALDIRCDSPDKRRLLTLTMSLDSRNRTRVMSTLLSEEERPPVSILEMDRPHADTLLACCSWCKKWRLPSGLWVEVEELVSTMSLFEKTVLPGVSHGICGACEASFRKTGGA